MWENNVMSVFSEFGKKGKCLCSLVDIFEICEKVWMEQKKNAKWEKKSIKNDQFRSFLIDNKSDVTLNELGGAITNKRNRLGMFGLMMKR